MRMVDRLLGRMTVDNAWEGTWSGAYQIPATDSSGRTKEGVAAGIVRNAREAYAANGVVAACLTARMSLFSEASFTWQSMIDKHLFGTTDLGLLQEPWPNATEGELLARLELGDSTAGNAFIRRVDPGDGSRPRLYEMRPENVVIISEEAFDSQGRVYKHPVGYSEDLRPYGGDYGDKDVQIFTPDEVCHYSPQAAETGTFRGQSWLAPILREVTGDQQMTVYKTTHLANGAQLGIVVKYSQKLQRATVDALREQISARYGGPANAGKTLVLDQGADVVVAGSTLQQLQYVQVQAAGEARICSAAGVPLEVVGLEGARAASGNYELAIRRMADLWARPRWRMACAALQHLLTFTNPLTGDTGPVTRPTRLWYDVGGIAALREGELARGQTTLVKMQAAAAAVTAGFSRKSAVAAADSGDLTQLKEDPNAGPPGNPTGVRPPQAGVPENLPGVVANNLPNSRPQAFTPMPSLPNGARGNDSGGTRG
jgi:hypothetical protein